MKYSVEDIEIDKVVTQGHKFYEQPYLAVYIYDMHIFVVDLKHDVVYVFDMFVFDELCSCEVINYDICVSFNRLMEGYDV